MPPTSSGSKNKPPRSCLLPTSCLLIVCIIYVFHALKMQAICSVEPSVDFLRAARCQVPEDRILLAAVNTASLRRVLFDSFCVAVRDAVSQALEGQMS
jgi:hypothetical protein